MKLLIPFLLFMVLCEARGQGIFDEQITEYVGAELTPALIQQYTHWYNLPPQACVRHIHHLEAWRGGVTTVQFELPAHMLQAFLKASPFKSAKLDSTDIKVSPIKGSSWFSPEQCRDLKKRSTFLSGSVSNSRSDPVVIFRYSLLVDTSQPDVYVIYVQDLE